MISIKGLGDEIFEVMMNHAQEKIQEQIMTAASYGQTSCTVRSKGITPSFLVALESEGVSSIEREDGSVKLFWEF
ncbi:hypothetical protein ACOX9P_09235 [Enterococcus durans]|uniref:hypothetical protein n=1 Tax=Enterococcus durans TaxID=53345 RepID=UPI003BEEB377